ncbi:MAG: DivIVA domain-containing protein [Acidimicrobiia bacterium]|nr:DivIVA domain-containing protein [Acidimicrobiia bacterium]
MRIRSATVDGHQFTKARRGYDAAEVDAVMARIAATLRDYESVMDDLEARLAAAETAARVTKSRDPMPDRPDSATAARGASEAEIEEARQEVEEARREVEDTRRRAEDALRHAQDEATQREAEIGALLEAARAEAERLRLETEQVRADVEAQRAALSGERDQVEADRSEAERLRLETEHARAEVEAQRAALTGEREQFEAERAEESEQENRAAQSRDDALSEANEIRARAEAEAEEIRFRAEEAAATTRETAQRDADALREESLAEIAQLRTATEHEIAELRSTANEHEQIVLEVANLRDTASQEVEELRAEAERSIEELRSIAERDAADMRSESLRQAEVLLAAARDEAQRIRTEALDEAAEIRAIHGELAAELADTRETIETDQQDAGEEARRTLAALADAEQARFALEERLDNLRTTVHAIEEQMRALAGDIADRVQKIGRITGTEESPEGTAEHHEPPMATMPVAGLQAPGEHDPLATAEPSAVVVIDEPEDEADTGIDADSRTYTQHHAYAEPDGSGRPPADRATIVPPELAHGAVDRDDHEGPYRTVYQRAGRNLRARLRQEGQDPTQRGR